MQNQNNNIIAAIDEMKETFVKIRFTKDDCIEYGLSDITNDMLMHETQKDIGCIVNICKQTSKTQIECKDKMQKVIDSIKNDRPDAEWIKSVKDKQLLLKSNGLNKNEIILKAKYGLWAIYHPEYKDENKEVLLKKCIVNHSGDYVEIDDDDAFGVVSRQIRDKTATLINNSFTYIFQQFNKSTICQQF